MTIRERVTVQAGGRIELVHPELPTGTETEVIVFVEPPSGQALRSSLRHYLAARHQQVPPGAGAFDSGHTSTAERAEEVLGELRFGRDAD